MTDITTYVEAIKKQKTSNEELKSEDTVSTHLTTPFNTKMQTSPSGAYLGGSVIEDENESSEYSSSQEEASDEGENVDRSKMTLEQIKQDKEKKSKKGGKNKEKSIYQINRDAHKRAVAERAEYERKQKIANTMNMAWNAFYYTELLVLDISNFGMQEIDGKFLSTMLYTNSTLQYLDISNNNLGSETAKEFGLGL